jgi:hypothetical protein
MMLTATIASAKEILQRTAHSPCTQAHACDSYTAATALPNLGKSDRYVGCVIGAAVPLVHRGATLDNGMKYAWGKCAHLANGITENELEGVSDYVYLIMEKIENMNNALARLIRRNQLCVHLFLPPQRSPLLRKHRHATPMQSWQRP